MGQYEPNDSRDVTLSDHSAPGEPDRTGHREGEARRQAEQQSKDDGQAGEAQVAYGNSRDRQGQMEQDVATGSVDGGDSFVGETADDPARRAKADASRPLSGD